MEKNHSNPEGQSAAAETASLAFFDRIYVINLNRRPDRWRGICTQLERFGVQHRVTRIQGGDDLPGALGCFDSHLNCLKRAQDDDAKTPLILEDDALFMPGWPSRIDSDIVELPMSWDLLYLGYSLDPGSEEAAATRFFSPRLLQFPKGCYTTMPTPSAASALKASEPTWSC